MKKWFTLAVTLLCGCGDLSEDRTVGITLAPENVQAIFTNHCIGCHGFDSPPYGQNLTQFQAYANIVGVTSGSYPSLKRVYPFKLDSSLLYQKIIQNSGFPPAMPLDGPYLDSADVQTVRVWIRAGAPTR